MLVGLPGFHFLFKTGLLPSGLGGEGVCGSLSHLGLLVRLRVSMMGKSVPSGCGFS